ncbi:glycosyltransferase family 10 domain-containing protein [Epilithonimonas sp. UC225_85]|uniref:glycosyltransferase family 10 domain-containing protein n=1 Tax=Epilithonimonas sp. UC225_85 TaxID=3350167 RepID=UPI0036D3CB0C
MSLKTNIKNTIADYKRFRKDQRKFGNDKVRYYNFWALPNSDACWFTQFLKHKNTIPDGRKINFLSVVGNPKISYFIRSPKIFFTGENIDNADHPSYLFKKYHLKNHDLSLGFSFLDDEKYLRFPLWILYMIPANASFEDIKTLINSYNNPNHRLNKNRQNFCSNISRADNNGIRKTIIDLLNPIETVKCAGSFLKNTNDLQEKFGDDKIEYLKTFKFNICPENSNTNGYVTEKLFEAIISGSIPIYWGSDNKPDPKIINQDAVLFFDPENPQVLFDKVNLLWNDEKAYEEFCQIKPFTENAAEEIWNKLSDLETKTKALIK